MLCKVFIVGSNKDKCTHPKRSYNPLEWVWGAGRMELQRLPKRQDLKSFFKDEDSKMGWMVEEDIPGKEQCEQKQKSKKWSLCAVNHKEVSVICVYNTEGEA